MSVATIPPLIGAYMARQRLPQSSWQGGALGLRLAGRYRVRVLPLRGGTVLLEAVIAHLPTERAAREQFVDRALRLAAARLQCSPCGIVTDRFAESLCLQLRHVPAESEASLEDAMQAFGTELTAWSAALEARP